MNNFDDQFFFVEHTNYKIEDIVKWSRQDLGYCNKVFYCETKDNKKFRVRIALNNDFINRENEYQVFLLLNKTFIFYDQKSGNSIEEWADGDIWQKKDFNLENFKIFVEEVEKIHATKIPFNTSVLEHQNIIDLSFIEKNFSKDIKNTFLRLNKYYQENFSSVLSHNDLSQTNLIFNSKNKTFQIIDFE